MSESAGASAVTSQATTPGTNATPTNAGESAPPETSEGSGPSLQRQEAKPKAAPKPQQTQDSDDEEAEVFGEKLSKKQLAEWRKAHEKRQEFDRAAHTKMQEAAARRKEAEAKEREFLRVANALEQDPWAIHKQRGLTDEQLDQLAEKRLIEQMKRAQMTPEQVEFEQTKAELARLKAEREQEQKTYKEQKQAELKAKFVEQYDREIGHAIEAANLPRTRRFASQVAGILAEYKRAGESIDPVLAANFVRDQFHKEMSHELGEMMKAHPERALALIPKEVIDAAIAKRTKEAQSFMPQVAPPPKKATPPQPPKPAAIPDFEDARKQLGIRVY